jgi:hypothetical protein
MYFLFAKNFYAFNVYVVRLEAEFVDDSVRAYLRRIPPVLFSVLLGQKGICSKAEKVFIL